MSFWPCSSNSNEGLVGNLKKTGIIHSLEVFEAMKRTDRSKYMLQMEKENEDLGNLSAYEDAPHPIGYNQTISAPHMVRTTVL